MKLVELIFARETILKYSNEKLSAKLAYKFMKFIKTTENEEAFLKQRITDIINEYGDKDTNGNIEVLDKGVKIKQGRILECKKAINELYDTEIDAPRIKFSLLELQELQLSMKEMSSLERFIIEEEII